MGYVQPKETLRRDRGNYFRGLLSFGIAALRRIRILEALKSLTVSEEEHLVNAKRAVNYINSLMREYASKGIILGDQDLAELPWYPLGDDISRVLLKKMAFSAGATIKVMGSDLNKINLSLIHLTTAFDLKKQFGSDYYLG